MARVSDYGGIDKDMVNGLLRDVVRYVNENLNEDLVNISMMDASLQVTNECGVRRFLFSIPVINFEILDEDHDKFLKGGYVESRAYNEVYDVEIGGEMITISFV
jgi:hypothetical protein